eukprot:6480090-Amphidinium_carterae.1
MKGSSGMVIKRNQCGAVAELGIRAGDRFEPQQTPRPWYWSTLHELKPSNFVMWRVANQSLCKHRNPLFTETLNLCRTMSIDAMHTLCLGVFTQFVHCALWSCVSNNMAGASTRSKEERLQANVDFLSTQLQNWYRSHSSYELVQ